MAPFRNNAVRNLVELHEVELNRFFEVWQKFCASGVALPETDDPSYESPEILGGHVFRAARGYLTWMGECLKRPVTDLDPETDAAAVARKARAFMDEMLAGWRRHLAVLEYDELAPATYMSRWGEPHTLEQMLEHAVVHPMRHRVQLERLMREAGA
jgi:uncharacterized damage-inducible protein DinB